VASIRAAQLQHTLAAMASIAGDPCVEARMFARVSLATLARVRGASAFDWLPLALDLELSAALEAELGPDSARVCARASVLETLRSPLLDPLLRGVQALFSLEPASLLRQAPRAWKTVYRDAGEVHYEIGEGAERLLGFRQLPIEVVGNRFYLEAIAGAFESVYTLCRVVGEVEVVGVEAEERRADLRFSWY
jgi:hypothetical protein